MRENVLKLFKSTNIEDIEIGLILIKDYTRDKLIPYTEKLDSFRAIRHNLVFSPENTVFELNDELWAYIGMTYTIFFTNKNIIPSNWKITNL